MNKTEHRFGSRHTLTKLDILEKYLPAYTTALKNTSFALHYVDAFAGTGACHIKIGTQRLMVPGSASIAIDCRPPFHQMVFIEAKQRHAKALERLVATAKRGDVRILRDDANRAIPEYLSELDQKRDRAVIFLDPYGMDVDWSTLVRISETRISDVWYLFPLSGFYRQAATDAADIDADKERAITRMLGDDSWRRDLYARDPQMTMFDIGERDVRIANPDQMLKWVKNRLETIFAWVAEPKLLFQTRQDGKQGAPLFALFFAISNRDAKAIGLAKRITNHILKQ